MDMSLDRQVGRQTVRHKEERQAGRQEERREHTLEVELTGIVRDPALHIDV